MTDPSKRPKAFAEVPMLRALSAVVFVLSTASCELTYGLGHVADPDEPAPAVDTDKLDILFVVDNSGSMADKQALLARTLYRAECPIADLTRVPASLQHPPPDERRDLAQVCGFAQLLAADGRDFRVGVITTDVDACDNAFPDQQGGDAWGFHPQRGCLQPVPSTGQKVLTRDDVDVEGKFTELVTSLGTFGSPFERGLDAAEIFLTHDSWVADGCDGDRDLFLRDDAKLLLVFVSDEDDCSHLADPAFPEEALTTCGPGLSLLIDHDPADCYTNAASLDDVSRYVDVFRSLKPDPADVSVAVISGSVESAGTLIPSGCIADTGGVPFSQCFASGGLENFTDAGEPCDPSLHGGEACCDGEPAARYFALRGALGFTGGSICSLDLVEPLIEATAPAPTDPSSPPSSP